jgi:DNA-binding CsgD family transcriptional regulator/GAF domain-containing protein
MTKLMQGDLERLLKAVEQVHSHADFSTLPARMVALQSELVPNELSTCTLTDKRRQRVEVAHSWQDMDVQKLSPPFLAHYQEHPVFQNCIKTQNLRAMKITDFLTQRQFQRTGFYNEFLKLLDVRFQLVYYLFNHAEAELAMVLHRRCRDFSERDRAMADLLRPHFAQAYQNAKALAERREWQERTQGVLAVHQIGMLFLNGDLKVERMTGNCERWLNEYFDRPRGVPVRLPDRLRRWLMQQRDFKNPETALGNTRPPLTVEGPGASLQVRFVQDSGRNVTLLFSEQRGLRAYSLAELGLTHREQEVLLWISEGKSNPEIGRILGISARTVEKHVERLLAKMNVESRKAAIVKVLSRPS